MLLRCVIDQTTPYAPVPIGLINLYFPSTSNRVPQTRNDRCWRESVATGWGMSEAAEADIQWLVSNRRLYGREWEWERHCEMSQRISSKWIEKLREQGSSRLHWDMFQNRKSKWMNYPKRWMKPRERDWDDRNVWNDDTHTRLATQVLVSCIISRSISCLSRLILSYLGWLVWLNWLVGGRAGPKQNHPRDNTHRLWRSTYATTEWASVSTWLTFTLACWSK